MDYYVSSALDKHTFYTNEVFITYAASGLQKIILQP